MLESTSQAEETTHSSRLSAVVIPLLKGVLVEEEQPKLWSLLIEQQMSLRDYVAVLGLELVLDEAEGYAFLRSKPAVDDGTTPLPRLMARRQLPYLVSLILALLRKQLAECDARVGDPRLILSLEQMVDLVRIFMPAGSNEAKLTDQIETAIHKIVELGFLRRLRAENHMYEVRRILKAFVDAQWLSEFEERLSEYRQLKVEAKEERDV